VVHRIEGLSTGQRHESFGHEFETLPELGRRLSTFATVNDIHFGETQCGGMEGDPDMGPVYCVPDGSTPYPEFMNAGAIREIAAINPDAVLVKGDLTCHGTMKEYSTFRDFYEPAFSDRLHCILGNHEAYHDAGIRAEKQIHIDLPGVTIAMIDTVRPGLTGGTVYDEDLAWLSEINDNATNPVLVFGHHHIWDPATPYRSKDYFGIQPNESEKFIALIAEKNNLRGYFAGHTHRNRVRYFDQTGDFPWVEVACVKDFPGAWAEYQVFEQGILQITHRISSPQALDWTEKTKDMYNGTYAEYAFGKLSDRCYVVCRTSDSPLSRGEAPLSSCLS
jgi:3',5'-cyclic AMP phosphodiesterase CpdA